MSKDNKCQGCGATLQTQDENLVGYVNHTDQPYCKACYQLMHYGLGSTHFHPEDLPQLRADSLILMVSSILHLDLLFSYPVYRYQPEAKIVYVVNQIDLLPKSTNLDKLVMHIHQKANAAHLPIDDVILMSSKNPYDVEELKKFVLSFSQQHIYLVGVQNSGKTTIFKALTENKQALAFKKAGLTQEAMIATFENKTIYDMPGLYQKGYLHQLFSYEVYKNLIPDVQIKPKIYQMKDHQTLCLEGIYTITLHGEDKTFTLYVDQHLNVHKTNDSRVKTLLEEKEKHFNVFGDTYSEQTFKIPHGKYQITFADMGFMHIVGPSRITVTFVKGLHISLMEALFS